MRLINSFTGHPQEAFFYLTNVEIEAKCGPAIAKLEKVSKAKANEKSS